MTGQRTLALIALPLTLLLTAAAPSLWLPPLGAPLRISEHFDLSNGPYGAGHRGVDLSAAQGQVVASPARGTVAFSGTVVDRPTLSVRIDEHTVFSIEPVLSDLKPGEAVARGQPLGTIDTGGHCDSECLHLGVRVNGQYVNPLRFFRGRPILVPW